MEAITQIELNAILADPALQPRVAGVDTDHVHELEAVAEHWPPLKVVRRGDRYLLVDGFHRFAAAQNLKLNTVAVMVLETGPNTDLHDLAFILNAAHGRPLTLSDRRAHAARLLRNHADWSDREVGRRCGLTQPTVAKVRQELEQSAAIPETAKRTGRDGRSYPAKPQRLSGTQFLSNVVERVVSALDRNQHRQIARYLERLAASLEEQERLDGFKTIEDAAEACRAVLGQDRAQELADRLGWSSRNILDVAFALGYREEREP